MGKDTEISWTDATWNPLRGCTEVSPGCAKCYAAVVAARFSGPGQTYEGLGYFDARGKAHWTGKVRTIPEKLAEPLRWKQPKMIFVNSTSDLFHEDVPDAFIDQVFATMALSPWHTYQVLTKRAARMAAYLNTPGRCGSWGQPAFELAKAMGWASDAMDPRWLAVRDRIVNPPLGNVWLGVSAEDQARADERIPHLLETPAAIRFLSIEPMLGPIDLKGWGESRMTTDPATLPATWAEFSWPDWVPAEQRVQVEEFWRNVWGRGPRQWLESARGEEVPELGTRIGATARSKGGWGTLCPARSPLASMTGRYLHSWNNIGRIIGDDGAVHYVSSSRGTNWLSKWIQEDGSYAHRIHWVIVGGESGPGARPMHPDWARSIRDQCLAARVPYHFKQWGAWVPDGQHVPWLRDVIGGRGAHAIRTLCPDGSDFGDAGREVVLRRLGKKRAGRLLDGVLHDDFPVTPNHSAESEPALGRSEGPATVRTTKA